MQKEHILIIGAGPSGISAAITLLKAGHNPLLVDKAAFPREKLCAGLFTAKAQDALRQILGNEKYEECLNASLISRQKTLTFWRKSKHIVTCPLINDILLVDRPRFDAWLVDYYKSLGGRIHEGTSLHTISSVDSTATISTLGLSSQIKYDYLIAADGANSRVRHLMTPKEKRKKITSLEVNLPSSQYQADGINIYFEIVPKTYAWVFDKSKTTCIGLSQMPGANLDLKDSLNSFLQMLDIAPLSPEQIKGAIIPCDKKPKTKLSSNVFLIGDAAGTIDPLTLEGIYFALQSGQDIATHLLSGCRDCTPKLSFTFGHGYFVQNHLMNHTAFMNRFYQHAPNYARFIARFYNDFIDHKPQISAAKMAIRIISKIIKRKLL